MKNWTLTFKSKFDAAKIPRIIKTLKENEMLKLINTVSKGKTHRDLLGCTVLKYNLFLSQTFLNVLYVQKHYLTFYLILLNNTYESKRFYSV